MTEKHYQRKKATPSVKTQDNPTRCCIGRSNKPLHNLVDNFVTPTVSLWWLPSDPVWQSYKLQCSVPLNSWIYYSNQIRISSSLCFYIKVLFLVLMPSYLLKQHSINFFSLPQSTLWPEIQLFSSATPMTSHTAPPSHLTLSPMLSTCSCIFCPCR